MEVTDQNIWSISPEYAVYDNRQEAIQYGVIEDAAYVHPEAAAENAEYDLFLVRVVLTSEIPHPMGKNVKFEDLLLAFINRTGNYEGIRYYTRVGAGWSCTMVNTEEVLVELADILIWLWIRSSR